MEPQVTQWDGREVWAAWWLSVPTGIIQMSARKKGCVCIWGVAAHCMRKTFGEEGESMLYILEVTRTQGLEFRGEIYASV